jgi:Ser-tRNA(Ala) deacylase AlaX
VHITDRAAGTRAVVAGAVDWARRFEHMQQHTGQHVLSAAFDRLFSNRTESFHLGRRLVLDRSRARGVGRDVAGPWTRPTASCGKTAP